MTYQVTMMTQQKVDTYQDDPDMGLGVGWGWGDDAGYSSSQVVNIHRGDLLFDMANPATKKIVFRGYSTGAFHTDPVKEDKLLSKALAKTFKNFPPREDQTNLSESWHLLKGETRSASVARQAV